MLKGLFNGSLILASTGFAIIIMTTPNSSLEILSQLGDRFELRLDSNSSKVCTTGCGLSTHATEVAEPDYYKHFLQSRPFKS